MLQVVTGLYDADTSGFWQTDSGFSYIAGAYRVNLLALRYTTEIWTQTMNQISEGVRGNCVNVLKIFSYVIA